MKIKIYRTDSYDYYEERLEEYEKDPASMAFDFIIDNVVVNTLDHTHKEDEDGDYYIHSKIIETGEDTWGVNEFVERIGYWEYLLIMFEDGTLLHDKLITDGDAHAFAEKLIGCLRAGSADNTEEYVDLDDIVF